MYSKIILHNGKERSVQNFHPWIFSGAVKKQDDNVKEGDIVEVLTSDNRYLATGHFHKGTIVTRVISWEKTEINREFWITKIRKAYEYRNTLGLINNKDTDAYRLIHGEGDGLPGLIIDIYNSVAVVQTHTAGMHLALADISKALQVVYDNQLQAIYNKSYEALLKQHVSSEPDQYLYKSETFQNSVIQENQHKFAINFIEGQKTGFFLDQRDNRKLLAHYSKGKTVLNTFCYSGGFSIYALAAGAKLVHSVDSSKKAIEQTEENVKLNFNDAPHESFTADVFDYLKTHQEKYDIVILDPPAFAKHLSAVRNATNGYRNLNYEGIKAVAPGGMLFTFSCSQAIDKELFRKIVFQSAAMAKRTVRIMHQVTQPADHPVNIYHPEGEYLKGILLYIE